MFNLSPSGREKTPHIHKKNQTILTPPPLPQLLFFYLINFFHQILNYSLIQQVMFPTNTNHAHRMYIFDVKNN